MKKSFLLIPLIPLLLAGCGDDVDCEAYCASKCGTSSTEPAPTSGGTTSETPTTMSTSGVTPTSSSGETSESTSGTTSPVGDHVTVLVLGQVGLYKGAKGVNYDIYENVVLYTEPIGTLLPGKELVTSTSGAEFTSWVSYENDGVPTVFTVVPNENYKVLYAQFGGGGTTTIPPTPTSGSTSQSPIGEAFTVYFQAKGWWNNDGASTYIYLWGNGGVENAKFPGEDMTLMKEYEDPIAGHCKLYSYTVLPTYVGMKFARHVGTEHYNETENLLIADRGTNNAVWCDDGAIGWFTIDPSVI